MLTTSTILTRRMRLEVSRHLMTVTTKIMIHESTNPMTLTGPPTHMDYLLLPLLVLPRLHRLTPVFRERT
jgi:hypothetical protein